MHTQTAPRHAIPVLAALLLAGCASVPGARIINLPEPSLKPAAHIDGITDDGVAIATISSVIEREMGFGPLPVTLHYYADTRAFETALVDLGYEPSFARKFARNMRAAGGYRRVLLNEAALAQLPRRSRVRVLAHELTHSLEYELGGGSRGTSDQWIREGFAEWVAVYVVDRLRGRPLSDVRLQKLQEFRRSNMSRAPRLTDMATSPGWVTLTGRKEIAPYAQAFLAVDSLIEQHGVGAMMEYFRLFTRSADRAQNFRTAFGVDLLAFDANLDARLRIRRGNTTASR